MIEPTPALRYLAVKINLLQKVGKTTHIISRWKEVTRKEGWQQQQGRSRFPDQQQKKRGTTSQQWLGAFHTVAGHDPCLLENTIWTLQERHQSLEIILLQNPDHTAALEGAGRVFCTLR